MYGNVETALDKAWGAGEGSPLPPPDEDPYEPLDPSPPCPSPPGQARPSPRPGGGPVAPRGVLVALVALVALAVTLLLLLGTLGGRRVSALEAALEAEKAKEAPPPAASASFLLYNREHSGCVVAAGRALSLAPCQPSSPAQRFQWLPGSRLRHVASGQCLGASRAAAAALVLLAPCRAHSPLQRWACGPGALLALAGTGLHLNFGHERAGRVLLYPGTGEWSRWVPLGSHEDVCSRANFPPCSKDWEFLGNSCYFFSKSVTSWENSQFFCSALGSQLLEIDDAEEKGELQRRLQGPAWLGIRRKGEGHWRRGDGTALTPNNSWWHQGEPNGGSLEECAAMGPDGLWADYPCQTLLAWVCEGPP